MSRTKQSSVLGGLWVKADDAEKEYINTLLADQRILSFLFEKLQSIGVTRKKLEELRRRENP